MLFVVVDISQTLSANQAANTKRSHIRAEQRAHWPEDDGSLPAGRSAQDLVMLADAETRRHVQLCAWPARIRIGLKCSRACLAGSATSHLLILLDKLAHHVLRPSKSLGTRKGTH